MKKLNQSGSHILAVVMVIVVIILVIAGGLYVLSKQSAKHNSGGSADSYVQWEWNGQAWEEPADAPQCESPLIIDSPVDLSQVNSILLPGEVRGNDFKAHGGFAVSDAANNQLVVSTIRDSYVYQGARYTTFGEVQYLFDFIDPCGIRYRFDHLATLTPTFQKLADSLPPPQPDDSRTTPIQPTFFQKGTIVGTEVGIKANKNVFFDFGVYDLRQPNTASKTELFMTEPERVKDKEQSYYALCWINNLPARQQSIAKNLPLRDGRPQPGSDYCSSQ